MSYKSLLGCLLIGLGLSASQAALSNVGDDGAQIVTQVPTEFKPCASDGYWCRPLHQWSGYYGAQNKFVTISGNKPFNCSPAGLGLADPLPGVRKTCYIKVQEPKLVNAVPTDYKPCAKDGGTCETSGNWEGYYGAQNKFVEVSGTGPFTCLPAPLRVTDPLPGVQKTCYVKGYTPPENTLASVPSTTTTQTKLVNAVPTDYKPCAKDFGTCNTSGNWEGYYGAQNKFVEVSGTGPFTCLPSHLRVTDPLPGVQKTCYVKVYTSPENTLASVPSTTTTTTQTKSNNALIWRRLNSPVHYWPVVNGQAQGGKNIGPAVDNQWVLSGAGDLNGDNKDDIIWRHTSTGQVLAWFSQEAQQRAKIGPPVGKEWRLAGAGDLNRDGNDDLIWQRNDGQVIYWPIVNGQAQRGKSIGSPVPITSYRLIGSGDLNKDGTDDIIWQRRDGQVHYWPIQNGQPQRGINIGNPVPPEWRLIGAGDINSDGTDDLIWHNKNGQAHYWPMQNTQPQRGLNIGSPVGPEWTLIGLGSF